MIKAFPIRNYYCYFSNKAVIILVTVTKQPTHTGESKMNNQQVAKLAIETLKEAVGHENCGVEVKKDYGYGAEVVLRAGYAWTGPGKVRSSFFVHEGQDNWPFAKECIDYLVGEVKKYNSTELDLDW